MGQTNYFMNDFTKNMMANSGFSEAEVHQLQNFFACLKDNGRLLILLGLQNQPATVSQMQHALGLEQTAVSHKLKNLRDQHLVQSTRVGGMVYYELKHPAVITYLAKFLDIVNQRVIFDEMDGRHIIMWTQPTDNNKDFQVDTYSIPAEEVDGLRFAKLQAINGQYSNRTDSADQQQTIDWVYRKLCYDWLRYKVDNADLKAIKISSMTLTGWKSR